ncbi:hypothetical protein ANANG_G00140850 [Anguilla anguilla]|uniref:Sulfatase N-terminal domain-containing protein n=1 Tax=Anguilla anguilla TaxID=7936 RepID=A0A9D3MCE4_ANGAN|nr:hypothetical protein ANANG_G00140850 [Anguilla anguilla]
MFTFVLLEGLCVLSVITCVYASWGNPNSNVKNQANELDKPTSQPHIIFILADDQGFRDVGYHGSEIKTPTLDRLASEGVKLENYYVQPICSPSRSQFMTGRYQIHTGLQHSIIRAAQPNCLPLENVTLPQKLKAVGYSTHMVGKWHLGFYKRECMPTQRGFDTFFGYLLGSGDYYSHYKCDGPGMCGYDLYDGEEAAWDQDRGSTPPSCTPRRRRYLERYKSIPNLHRRKYAAMVSCLDEAVHNITLALKRPLLLRKGTSCRGLVHITDWFPTLVTLAEGSLEEDLNLDGYDVWEAISEGFPSPRQDILHNIDPIYTKAKNGSWKAGHGIWNTAVQAAIRVGDWKLLTGVPGYSDWVPPQTFSSVLLTNRWHNERVRWDRGKSVWLFNITADPYERVDLSRRHPQVVKRLLLRLAQYNKTAVPVRYPAKDSRSNPQLNGGVWGPWYKEKGEEDGESNLLTNQLDKRRRKKKARRKHKQRRGSRD